ncbi:hypothetical protein DJ023_18695 [Pantoea agglomerans]|nr:hypothetical protein [Pantoea agglomerans]
MIFTHIKRLVDHKLEKSKLLYNYVLWFLYYHLLHNTSMYYATITPYRFTQWIAILKINLPIIYKIIQQGTSDKSHRNLWLLSF